VWDSPEPPQEIFWVQDLKAERASLMRKMVCRLVLNLCARADTSAPLFRHSSSVVNNAI